MSYLARVLKSKLWDDLSDDQDITLNSVPELLHDACGAKNGATSFWAVDYSDRSSLSRIVAAMATINGELRGTRIGLILESDVEDIGVQVKKTKGHDILDDGLANSAHRDLVIDDLKKAFRITRHVRKNIITFSATEVKQFFKQSIDSNYFSVKKLNKIAITKLGGDGLLYFNHVAASSSSSTAIVP